MGAPAMFRYGWLKPLPNDYAGERHVVILKREQTKSPGIEWCEFEERIGPTPTGLDDGAFVVYLRELEMSADGARACANR
jgi:hypothetical protein